MAVSVDAFVLVVPCTTCTFFDVPPPEYVPVTLATLSESALSPIWTVTPDLILSAVRLVVVTPFIVCVPVSIYCPLWFDPTHSDISSVRLAL